MAAGDGWGWIGMAGGWGWKTWDFDGILMGFRNDF